MANQAIGARIAASRRAQRLTIAELAEKANVHPTTIIAWEQGRRFPNSEQLKAVCGALGCSSDYILGLREAEEEALFQRVMGDALLRQIAADDAIYNAIATLRGVK